MTGRELLKQMAKQAKDRLQGRHMTSTSKGNVTCIRNGENYIKTITIKNDIDKDMYTKVKDCIKSDAINPLNELIDFNYYKTLSNEQKERYFFKIADKYRQLRQIYENEKIKEFY